MNVDIVDISFFIYNAKTQQPWYYNNIIKRHREFQKQNFTS